MILLLFITGILLFLFFLWFAIVSIIENELLAVKRSLILAIALPAPFIFLAFNTFAGSVFVGTVVLIILVLSGLVLGLPINGRIGISNDTPKNRYDERDTMFSRKEIMSRPEKQNLYYKNNPDKSILDKEWQLKPGLMSDRATMYSPLTFAAADASFFPIEQLRPFVNGDINKVKKEIGEEKLNVFITNWVKKLGAVSVGFCKMQDYHYYSVRGRGSEYGNKVEPNHTYGIAITVEMDKDFVANGPAGPTLMESAKQYLNAGVIAIQLGKFIRELGYEARAHIDGDYKIICPLVARDSGLGEIGRMGLLMTPELGPRVRIAVVTTDIPVKVTLRKPDYSVHDFCDICKKCADICPSQAIPKTKIDTIDGVQRWQINHEKCYGYWCTVGTDCGRCLSVCPYSHPNNILHNMVRWGIKSSWVFRRFALLMDDYFYGRKPKSTTVPKWMLPD